MDKLRERLSLKTWGRTDSDLFEQHLFAARNDFLIRQARAGLRNTGSTISKGEADRRLKAALDLLQKGGGR